MNADLALVRSLRKVLESASEGMGIARSVAEELRTSPPPGPEASRMILLGYPIETSLSPLVGARSEEASMLASLIVAAPRSSASLVGRSGDSLGRTLERWVRARDSRRLEQKVLKFRSLVTSGVLGAVTAMVASLGPVVGSLNFEGRAPPIDPGALLVGAAAMACISSAVLGLFMSGRGFLTNLAVTLGIFVLVSAVASPLATIPLPSTWGVK